MLATLSIITGIAIYGALAVGVVSYNAYYNSKFRFVQSKAITASPIQTQSKSDQLLCAR
ncbi:MAG: hypothetical protein AB7E31_13295 [Desulfitobacterium sp.]